MGYMWEKSTAIMNLSGLYSSAEMIFVSSSRVKILRKQGSRYLIEASNILFISKAPLALTKVAIP